MDKIIVGVVLALFTLAANAATESAEKNSVLSVLDSENEPQISTIPPDFSNSLQNSIANLHHAYDHLYFGIIVGVGVAKIGKQQTDVSSGGWGSEYLPNNAYNPSLLYGANGGCEFKLKSNASLSIGLGMYQNLNYYAKGQVWVINTLNPSPDYNYHSLNYQYKIQSTRLMLETQLNWLLYLNNVKISPFILIGIGPSINSANSYEDIQIDPIQQPTPGFKTRSNVNFAYQLGFGIACPFNSDHDRLSIGYRYVDLGRAYFNSRQSFDYQLEAGKIRTNEVYLSYTHLFGYF